jgi:aminopeptidase N
MSSPLNRTLLLFFFLTLAFIYIVPVQAAESVLRDDPTETNLPRLVISDFKTDNRHGRTILSLSIFEQTKTPLTLQVPILIRTGLGDIRFNRTISAPRTDMAFALPDPPLEVILDPDQELLRELDPSELPPLWSRFLDAKEKTVVLDSVASRGVYASLLEYLQERHVKIITADEIKNAELHTSAILFLGQDNAAGRTLFGRRVTRSAGFTVEVHNNPLNRKHMAVLVSSSSAKETEAAVRQLPHSGDFSFLQFKKGRILKKHKSEGTPGQHYTLERLPAGVPVTAVSDFAGIIDKLAASRVVYVGETHTSPADHLLQFRVIQALYKKDPHLAIGMEMFPSAAQQTLDEYVLGDTEMNEKAFLRESKYFHVWGYDWRQFRDIFNFARLNRIPVIGLNLDQKIVSDIFRTGTTDNLTPEQKQALPASRDLDMPGYSERLSRMHDAHNREEVGNGTIGGFIQAQGLWDETMAQTISAYLGNNPSTRMVVLAGVQHIRKDSGIPPRVTRRLAVSQASVLNILSENAPADAADMADFFFLVQPVSLPPAAKLGIVLEPMGTEGSSRLQITSLSPHGKAGVAGLKEKDILLAINNHPVYTMDDVRIAMIDVEQGDTITVKIRRGPEPEQEMEYQVTAQALTMDKPHP